MKHTMRHDCARWSLRFLACLTIPLYTACAQQTITLEEGTAASVVAALQMRIAAHAQWDRRLRIALRHRSLSWRGTMQWTQREDGFRIAFSDILGRRLMLIESLADGSVASVDFRGYREYAPSAAVLIQSILGVEVPLGGLHYWLSGAPRPDSVYAALEFNTQGQLQAYTQDGWTINYTAYDQDTCVHQAPSRIVLSHTDTQLWLYTRPRQSPYGAIQTSDC